MSSIHDISVNDIPITLEQGGEAPPTRSSSQPPPAPPSTATELEPSHDTSPEGAAGSSGADDFDEDDINHTAVPKKKGDLYDMFVSV